jgi:hypothetical protein
MWIAFQLHPTNEAATMNKSNKLKVLAFGPVPEGENICNFEAKIVVMRSDGLILIGHT